MKHNSATEKTNCYLLTFEKTRAGLVSTSVVTGSDQQGSRRHQTSPPVLPPSRVSLSRCHTHTHTFNGPFSGTTWVSWCQKGKTNVDFTEVRDSEWQWRQLGHVQVCTDSQASTPPLSFLQARCPSCRPTNSVKALKALSTCHGAKFMPRLWSLFQFAFQLHFSA